MTILLLCTAAAVCLFGPLVAAMVSGYNPLIPETGAQSGRFLRWLYGSLALALSLFAVAWIL